MSLRARKLDSCRRAGTFIVWAAFDYPHQDQGPVDTSSDEIGDNEDEGDDERDEEA
jgi:hypothetical protein